MGLRDASRFAAALSYSLGEYVSVISSDPIEHPYYEWWYAGALWRIGAVPPPEKPELGGLSDPPQRGIVEESAEAAEDRQRRAAEKSRKIATCRRSAGYGPPL
jgi:hypothetical protein